MEDYRWWSVALTLRKLPVVCDAAGSSVLWGAGSRRGLDKEIEFPTGSVMLGCLFSTAFICSQAVLVLFLTSFLDLKNRNHSSNVRKFRLSCTQLPSCGSFLIFRNWVNNSLMCEKVSRKTPCLPL
jgi:hypothetical protein